MQTFSLWTFFKLDVNEKRFSSKPFENLTIKEEGKPDQFIEGDSSENFISEYVVIPSLEDGNKNGLSERAIVEEWKNIYALKKIPTQKLETQQKIIRDDFEKKITDLKSKISELKNTANRGEQLIKLQDELARVIHEKEKQEIEMEKLELNIDPTMSLVSNIHCHF